MTCQIVRQICTVKLVSFLCRRCRNEYDGEALLHGIGLKLSC